MKFTRVLRQAEVNVEEYARLFTGKPTGLTGLYEHPKPRVPLMNIYEKTLNVLKDFPKDSIYKQSVEKMTAERMAIVKGNEIIERIENKIGGGLIEEILIQAHDELALAKELKELKVWEELEEKPLDDQWVYFGKKI